MGISALLGEDAATIFDGDERASRPAPRGSRLLPIEQLKPSPFQPRRRFDDAEIDALADSLRRHGLLQPLLVRPIDGEQFQIVAGERRWRAAQRAGLDEVPVLVRELGDRDTLEIALVENVQRKDLGALEEAEGYRRLIEEFGHAAEHIATAVGRSRSHVANTLRLLALPATIRTYLENEDLTAGHARALLGAQDPVTLADLVIEQNLSVRQTEELVRRQGQARPARPTAVKDADIASFEDRLTRRFGLPITIKQRRKGGELVVRWQTLDQLDQFLGKLDQE